jgi:hypothetical protein
MTVRFRIRTLMATVALVAFALALPVELRARRERRRLASNGAYYLKVATVHDRERAVCESAAGRKPYDSIERQATQVSWLYGCPNFRDWPDEAAWHASMAEECRRSATSIGREEQAVRRRLLLPVIF